MTDTEPSSFEHAARKRHGQFWYSEDDLKALKQACVQVRAYGTNVEVGCFTGQSTELIAHELGNLLCVDPWGDMAYADRPDLGAEYAYPRFLENTKYLPVTRFRCGWEQFFELFDGDLAFLHIDAVHEFEHVYNNIQAALPYCSQGSVICGHDFVPYFPGVEEAVRKAFGDAITVEAKVWCWVHP